MCKPDKSGHMEQFNMGQLTLNHTITSLFQEITHCVQLAVKESVRHIPLSVLRPTNIW